MFSIRDFIPIMIDDTNSSNGWPWRTANGAMALFFFIASYVQLNDPDWPLWVCLYGLPSLTCAVFVFLPNTPASKPIASSGIVAAQIVFIAVMIASIIARNYSESMGNVSHLIRRLGVDQEDGREVWGLLIVAVWLLVILVRLRTGIQWSSAPVGVSLIVASLVPLLAWFYWHFIGQINRDLPQHCQGSL